MAGRAPLFLILDFLSSHKRSTCKEIAKYEILKEKKQRKEKSVTDDLRKFIQGNLIPRRIVKEDGFKKTYNKNEQAYSLTSFGILYYVHLFSKQKNNSNVINNLSIEYKDVLPYVFRQFPFFRRMFGKNFLEIIDLKRISDGNFFPKWNLTGPIDSVTSFVDSSYEAWRGDPVFLSGRWVKQITLCIYNNMLSHLFLTSIDKYLENGEEKRQVTDNTIEEFWENLDNEDPQIKTWYSEFINEAMEANKERKKGLAQMKKLLKSS